MVATVGCEVNGEPVKKATVGGVPSEGMCDAPMLGWKGGGAGGDKLLPVTAASRRATRRRRSGRGSTRPKNPGGGQAAPGQEAAPLFELKTKLTKDEKKAEAARKKAEREAKKAAKKGGERGRRRRRRGPVGGRRRLRGDHAKAAEMLSPPSSARYGGARHHRRARGRRRRRWDVKFEAFSIAVGGSQLVSDCEIESSQGCRYGLLGDNGSGKSNVLAAIAQREVPLPRHIDVFHLHEEAPPSEQTGVEAVVAHVVEEAAALEALSQSILEEFGADDERLEEIYDRLGQLDPTGAEPRARKILSGPRLRRPPRADGPQDQGHERRGGACASRWRRRCSPRRRCCSSTSRPTTSTSRRASGSRTT